MSTTGSAPRSRPQPAAAASRAIASFRPRPGPGHRRRSGLISPAAIISGQSCLIRPIVRVAGHVGGGQHAESRRAGPPRRAVSMLSTWARGWSLKRSAPWTMPCNADVVDVVMVAQHEVLRVVLGLPAANCAHRRAAFRPPLPCGSPPPRIRWRRRSSCSRCSGRDGASAPGRFHPGSAPGCC